MPLRFVSKESRDALVERLATLAVGMLRSRDQGGDHKILVTDEMMEDIQTAACVVAVSEIVSHELTVANPECEFCEKRHDPRVGCPEYVAHQNKCPHGMSSRSMCSTCNGY